MRIPFTFLVIFTALMFSSCAGVRKAHAAKILSRCSFQMEAWQFDSVSIDSSLFPRSKDAQTSLFPNPQVLKVAQELIQGKGNSKLGVAYLTVQFAVQNPGKDSIWIQDMKGSIRVDTLFEAQWNSTPRRLVAPGVVQIPLSVKVNIDTRLFKVLAADSATIQGGLQAALTPDGELVPFQFQRRQHLPKEEIANLVESAKKDVLQTVLGSWAKSFQ